MIKRLPTSIIAITGPTGVGKSSLAGAKLIRDYKKYKKDRYLESLSVVKNLVKKGYNGLKLNKKNPLYFSNTIYILDYKAGISTWDCSFSKLGVPNKQYSVQNLPYGSIVVITEADNDINCNDNRQGINEYIRAFLKLHRHNGITLILDLQDFSRLAKDLKLLVHYIYFVRYKKDYNFFGHIFLTKWHYFVVDMSLLNLFSSQGFLKIPVREHNYFWAETFNFWGNIYKRYDSTSGLAYFLDGIDHYDYIPPVVFNGSPESVKAFTSFHPIIPPENFDKGKKGLDLRSLDDNSIKYINNLTKQFKDSLFNYIRSKGGDKDA